MNSNQRCHAVAVAILCIALPGCPKSVDMSNPESANSNVTDADTVAGTPAAESLPPGFVATAFTPGRYVTIVGRLLNGTHALQVLSEDSTAMLSIELLADGTATATRGWKYSSRNDGPKVQRQESYREQQGYRGTYSVRDTVADVVLNSDDTVCPPSFKGEYKLDRVASLTLRCVHATPPATLGAGTGPVLLCRSVTPGVLELQPQIVESVADGQWLVLGSGNGLQISVKGRPPAAQAGEPMSAVVTAPSTPIAPDAWEHRLATL